MFVVSSHPRLQQLSHREEEMRLLKLGLVLAAAAGIALPAGAQDYPTRNVKIIVPFGAGGPADVYARFVGQHLSEALKRSFVIENRPGAGAVIGTDEVVKAAPDGYTLLMMSNTHKIGRGSRRERVEISVVVASLKK